MKPIAVFLLTIILCSCQSNETKKLKEENERLKNLNNTLIEESKQEKIYAFVILKVSLPTFKNPVDNKYRDWKEEVIISNIEEFEGFNDDVEFKFMDETESKYRSSKMRGWPIKIIDRNCYRFSSYSEASKKRSSLKM